MQAAGLPILSYVAPAGAQKLVLVAYRVPLRLGNPVSGNPAPGSLPQEREVLDPSGWTSQREVLDHNNAIVKSEVSA